MKERFFFKISSNLVTQIITLALAYFTASILSVEQVGTNATANSFVGVWLIFIDLGLTSIHFQYNKEEDYEIFFSNFVSLKIILLVLNITPILFILLIFEIDPLLRVLIIFVVVSTVITFFQGFLTINIQSKFKTFKLDIPILLISILRNLTQLIFLLNLAFFPINPLIGLALIQLLYNSISFITFSILSRGEIIFVKPKIKLMKQYVIDAKPLMLQVILSSILANIGNVLLALSYGTEILGYYYFINSTIIKLILLISNPIGVMFQSLLPKMFENGETSSIQDICLKFERYFSILHFIFIIITFLSAEILLELFLPKYLESLIILQILIFVPYFISINRPYLGLMIPGGRQHISSTYSIFKILFETILIILVVPTNIFGIPLFGFGTLGLCLISFISPIINYFFFKYFIKKYFNIRRSNKILLHIVMGIISIITCLILKTFIFDKFFEYNLFISGLLTLVGIGLFLLQLIIIKEFKIQDLKYFISLIKFKTYKQGLIEDFKIVAKKNS